MNTKELYEIYLELFLRFEAVDDIDTKKASHEEQIIWMIVKNQFILDFKLKGQSPVLSYSYHDFTETYNEYVKRITEGSLKIRI